MYAINGVQLLFVHHLLHTFHSFMAFSNLKSDDVIPVEMCF